MGHSGKLLWDRKIQLARGFVRPLAERLNPMSDDFLHKKINISKKVKIWFVIIAFTLIALVSQITNKGSSSNQAAPLAQNQTKVVAGSVGCVVAKPAISYSVLAESARQSDLATITIKECYILLAKKAPTISELTQLSASLGTDNQNIEFTIFDDAKAYNLYQKYIISHKEMDASDQDWKFLYDHFLATYLKANTNLNNNYLQPVGNAYYIKGQTSIPEIPIAN